MGNNVSDSKPKTGVLRAIAYTALVLIVTVLCLWVVSLAQRAASGVQTIESKYQSAGKASPAVEWTQTYEGTYGNAILDADESGYLIAGYSMSTPVSVKTDAHGNQLAEIRFGDDETKNWTPMLSTGDGGYILFGEKGPAYFRVIKTDAEGNKLWDTKIGFEDYASGGSVQQTADGGYIVGSIIDHQDALIRLDAAGKVLWQRMFDPLDDDLGYVVLVQQTMDGGYIAFGADFRSSTGNTSGESMFLLKTDADGKKLWSKIYKGYGYWAQQTADGGYIMYGVEPRDALHTINGQRVSGIPHVILTKTDADGDELWSVTFRGLEAFGKGVQQTKDGGYILYGNARDWSGECRVIRTDAGGNTLWDKLLGDKDKMVTLRAVRQVPDGGYLLCGGTEQLHASSGSQTSEILLIKVAPQP